MISNRLPCSNKHHNTNRKHPTMAFFITNAARTPDGGWAFAHQTKVRLTGPEGPLARHIITLPGRSTVEWSIEAAEIAVMLQCSAPSDQESQLLLWDSGDPDSLPMRVVRFCGVSREFETELLVHMEILKGTRSHVQGSGRLTNEALRLVGGRATPKARWTWAAPKMSSGSTIVGPEQMARPQNAAS